MKAVHRGFTSGVLYCLFLAGCAAWTTAPLPSPSLSSIKSASRREPTMKTIATSSYAKLVAILAVAAPLAACVGTGGWH